MKKDLKNIDLILLKYFAGEATDIEMLLIDYWKTESQENSVYFKRLQKNYNEDVGFDPKHYNIDKSWENIKNNTLRKKRNITFSINNVLYNKYLKFAASVLLILSTSILGIMVSNWFASNRKPIELVTGIGELKEHTFSDGTKVWLNTDSKLVFPNKFRGSTREVNLDGEAYFIVTHNPAKPFIVNVGGSQIKVLGTSFVATGYQNDLNIKVTLIEGKIRFENKSGKVDLNPSEQISFSIKSEKSIVRKVHSKKHTAWLNGLIVFDNEKFSDIARKLERYYNIQILYHPEIGEQSFTGTFPKTEKIEFILDLFQMSEPIEYQTTDKVIYIKKKMVEERPN